MDLYRSTSPTQSRSRYQAPLRRPCSYIIPKGSHSAQSSLDSVPAAPDVPLSILPLPFHLYPTLLPQSKLSAEEKRDLFCTNFLRAASTDSADMLEWLLSIPEASSPQLGHKRANSRAAAMKYSTSSLSTANSSRILHDLPDNTPRKWVDLEFRDEDGNTALILAVALGHAESVRVLVEAGVDIDGTDNG